MGDRSAALQCFRRAAECAKDAANPQAPQLSYQLAQSSVIADPTFAQGFFDIGNANFNYQRVAGAIGAWRRALELPDGPNEGDMNPERRAHAMVNLGHALQVFGRMDEALSLHRQALDIDLGLARAWLNISLCLQSDGDLDRAVSAAETAYEIDPKDSAVEMCLAFALLFSEEYAAGLRHFESRFAYKLHSFLSYPYPKWDGSPNQNVYLVTDQGIGDTLSFARFVAAAAARSKFIHMAVQPELLRLFAASLQRIPNLNIVPLPCPWPPADCWSTFMSLPTALGLTDEEIINAPNIDLPAFQAPTTQWKSSDRKLHIGVCWSGSVANDINRFRSFPLDHLLELYRVPGIQLYSLQVGEQAMALHEAGCATLMRDLSPMIRDVSDTIGLLAHLDLVIGCESALGHICALTGTEFWMPYSYHGRDFRVGFDGTKRLWTPRHRVFKQGKDATWEPVFDRIIEALRERVDAVVLQEVAA